MEIDLSLPENVIYQMIQNQIMTKKLFPGSRIVEEQLAQDSGISRTPIRVALKRLSYEGLVTIIPRKGAVVASPTKEEMSAAYDCKQLLECKAISLACKYISGEDIDALEALVQEELETHRTRNLPRFIEINQEFHRRIAHASRNSYFEKYIMELHHTCDVYLIFYDRFASTTAEESQALKEHRAILEALRTRDEAAAVQRMRLHNQVTLNHLQAPPVP